MVSSVTQNNWRQLSFLAILIISNEWEEISTGDLFDL